MNEEPIDEIFRIAVLAAKYFQKEISSEEMEALQAWIARKPENRLLFDDLQDQDNRELALKKLKGYWMEEAWARTHQKIHKTTQPRYIKWLPYAAACLLITGFIFFLKAERHTDAKPQAIVSIRKEILPGSSKARLLLANGRSVVLSDKGDSSFFQGSVTIKQQNGQLAYQGVGDTQTASYNTLITPRGGQYRIVLQDGSRVWLNSASSIRFPTTFDSNTRSVWITGEAYFEVAKDMGKPFTVHVGETTIEVLGTQFDVMAYQDESAVATTLLEGSVKITMPKGNHKRNWTVLKPGQQATINEKDELSILNHSNTQKAVAWKDNLFWFDNDNIQEVMRQLARWYNVTIVIQGNIPDLFTGRIPRNLTFSKIFEVLQKTGRIHCKIETDKIIVTP